MLKNKAAGFYFAIIACVIGIISMIRFVMWAPKHGSMDYIIVAALAIGIILDIVLMVREYSILKVLTTACYSVPAVKILTDSVGSFVDAFQGINMFGDATQVGTIISIAAVMFVGVLLSIISSFLKYRK